MPTSQEIRQQFLDFFRSKGHTIVPSASLVPIDDPTLLFTNAGMNQFKDVFLNTGKRDYKRAADSQKCIRVSGKHNDLEEVGRDTYHHTFFEMLGNWSFGDYYKKEAIEWAWELLTGIWKLPKDMLYATVYKTDEEAEELWKEVTDIDPSHIMRFGEKDNFWEMGDTGPCGPCTEIHIDLGPGRCDKSHVPGHTCGVNQGCARFIEIWNLVFIQYNRNSDGSLTELPARHVDTGMGFERITAVLQNKRSNYETDLFTPIISAIEKISGKKYADDENKVAMCVIADHIRALTFAIADGAVPSNEGRGYVLRRILRRAARFGRTLGMTKPFLHKLTPAVVEIMGGAFPEIVEKEAYCRNILELEEESFCRTLDNGIQLFEQIAAGLSSAGQTMISGKDAFRLYDTYGFPIDLTRLMAEEKGMTIDMQAFEEEMNLQKERARSAGKFTAGDDNVHWGSLKSEEHSRFTGYETIEEKNASVVQIGESPEGYRLIFNRTPFYAESGGQVGDTGVLLVDGEKYDILDTKKSGDKIIHYIGKEKPLPQFETCLLQVDADNRRRIASHHTATHLLHAALRKVLGAHVHQAGSLVESRRLRFDYTHTERLTPQEITRVEKMVNEWIAMAFPVTANEMGYKEAIAAGATALFGEKYGDRVRVIKISDISQELCGGTHVRNTSEILCFRIVSEGGIATGTRRIEAVAGPSAIELAGEERQLVGQIADLLKCPRHTVLERVQNLVSAHDELEKQLAKFQQEQARAAGKDLWNKVRSVNNTHYLVARMDNTPMELLRESIDNFKQKYASGIILLGSVSGGKVSFAAGVTSDLTGRLKAGDLVKEAAVITGGSGGGRPDMAQAGGKNPEKIDQALQAGEDLIKKALG